VALICGIALPSCAAIAGDNPWGWLVPKGGPVWSASIAEAKRRGVLITPLTAEPAILKVAGQELKIREAWIEKRYDIVFEKGGTRRTDEDGYNLVFAISGEMKALQEGKGYFYLEGKGASFLHGYLSDGSLLNVERLEEAGAAEVGVLLKFKAMPQEPLKVRLKRPAEQK
jgi:hypothetical protein